MKAEVLLRKKGLKGSFQKVLVIESGICYPIIYAEKTSKKRAKVASLFRNFAKVVKKSGIYKMITA